MNVSGKPTVPFGPFQQPPTVIVHVSVWSPSEPLPAVVESVIVSVASSTAVMRATLAATVPPSTITAANMPTATPPATGLEPAKVKMPVALTHDPLTICLTGVPLVVSPA